MTEQPLDFASWPTTEVVQEVPQQWTKLREAIGTSVPEQEIDTFEVMLTSLTSRVTAFAEATGHQISSPTEQSKRSLVGAGRR